MTDLTPKAKLIESRTYIGKFTVPSYGFDDMVISCLAAALSCLLIDWLFGTTTHRDYYWGIFVVFAISSISKIIEAFRSYRSSRKVERFEQE